ncbi:2902_t:CDS:1, partial [Scutellospora calospora]
ENKLPEPQPSTTTSKEQTNTLKEHSIASQSSFLTTRTNENTNAKTDLSSDIMDVDYKSQV